MDLTRGVILPGVEKLPFAESIANVGLAISPPSARTVNGTVDPSCTDQSVLVAGTCHDAHGALGVMLRVTDIGTSRCGYIVVVRPSYQQWSVLRFVNTKAGLNLEPFETKTHEAIAGIGHPNVVELRAAESWFELRINDQRVTTFEDASFGFGLAGWHVTSYGAARVVLTRFEAVDLA